MWLPALPLPVQTSAPRVELVRVPDGGLQPRAIVDEHGRLHLVTFHGDPKAGALVYRRSGDGGRSFEAPQPVSHRSGAVAIGNVRGAQVALGRGGRVHVVWNGAGEDGAEAPFCYTRSDADGTFEPERDLAGEHHGLDGGGAVAADAEGDVWVVWQAPGTAAGEAGRRVWVRHSRDDGATFEPERALDAEGDGVCPCCGMAAQASPGGALAVLYRCAREGVHRDATLLWSETSPEPARSSRLDAWTVPACVMSTFALARGPGGLLGAFESDGEVRFAALEGDAPVRGAPGGGAGRKHPSLACAPDGTVCLAWIEGSGWGRGGTLAWQLFDSAGNAQRESAGPRGDVPAWSLVQAVALPDGHFVLLY